MLRLHRNFENTKGRGGDPLVEDVDELMSLGTWRTRTSPTAMLVLDGVGGEVDDADVVTVDQSGLWQGVVQLHKPLMKPAHLHHVVGHDVVPHLSAQTGDDILMLRGPGDEVVAQEHRVARSGSTSVETTSLVSISVDDEVWRRGAMKKHAMMEKEKSKWKSWRWGTDSDGEGQVIVWVHDINHTMESHIALSIDVY
jgi:hypothetical protein